MCTHARASARPILAVVATFQSTLTFNDQAGARPIAVGLPATWSPCIVRPIISQLSYSHPQGGQYLPECHTTLRCEGGQHAPVRGVSITGIYRLSTSSSATVLGEMLRQRLWCSIGSGIFQRSCRQFQTRSVRTRNTRKTWRGRPRLFTGTCLQIEMTATASFA